MINVGKCHVVFQQKGEKSPDYQHCKWGGGAEGGGGLFVWDCSSLK